MEQIDVRNMVIDGYRYLGYFLIISFTKKVKSIAEMSLNFIMANVDNEMLQRKVFIWFIA